jgi:hypothetical protein
MFTTGQNLRLNALVLSVVVATAAVGAGAIFLSQRAANSPSTQTVQLGASLQPVSDAATGGGYATASTYSPDGSYVIESDRGIIVVPAQTTATDSSDVLSRYVANTATGLEPVSDAATGGYATSSTYAADGSYVIESDRGIIVVPGPTSSTGSTAPEQVSDAASGAGYQQH